MRFLITAALLFFSAGIVHGQVTVQQGATLSQLINNLYGGNGIQLKDTGHQAHFGESLDFQQFSLTLQRVLQARTLFPLPSAVGLVSYRFNEQTGTYERVQGTFGPILADRATTLGKGNANFGAHFTFSDYETVDGSEEIVLTLRHCLLPQCVANIASPFLQDFIRVHMRFRLTSQALTSSVMYGLSDSVDIGFLLPYIRNDLRIFTRGEIVLGPQSVPPGPHEFDSAVETPDQMGSAHAIGVGDIVLRGKMRLKRIAGIDTAVLADISLPTGDKENFLGTGEVRFKSTFIASLSGPRFTPHLNLGYELNGGDMDLNVFDYRLGTEIGASPRITLVTELLGVVRPTAGQLFRTRALETQELVGRSEMDGGLGAKWQVGEDRVLMLNFLVPLNDRGLRSHPVITFGVQLGI
jgi:hypothetical protein